MAPAAPVRLLRILILSPHYPPDVAATGQLVADLAEDLAAAGHRPIVLAARPARTSGTAPRSRWYARETRNGVEICWLGVPQAGRGGTWARLVPFAGYCAAALARALVLRRVDIVFAQSTPPLLAGMLAWLLSRGASRRFVYNVQDVYPDLGSALGLLRPGAVLRAARAAEAWLARRADVVSLVGDDVRARYVATRGREIKTAVIPNWADARALRPLPRSRNSFIARHELIDKFVVMYSGNFGRAHDVEMLPQVAAALADVDDLRLVLVGDGPGRAAVADAIARRRLDNVLLLPFQPRAELRSSLSAAHVGLVLQRAQTAGLLVPSKLYGVLASGGAVVAAVPGMSEAAQLVRRAHAGVVTSPGDAAAMAAAIRTLHGDRALLARYRANARRVATGMLDRTQMTARYRRLFERLAATT